MKIIPNIPKSNWFNIRFNHVDFPDGYTITKMPFSFENGDIIRIKRDDNYPQFKCTNFRVTYTDMENWEFVYDLIYFGV